MALNSAVVTPHYKSLKIQSHGFMPKKASISIVSSPPYMGSELVSLTPQTSGSTVVTSRHTRLGLLLCRDFVLQKG